MSLFLAIPVDDETVNQLIEKLELTLGKTANVLWYREDGGHHITLTHIATKCASEEEALLQRLQQQDWMSELVNVFTPFSFVPNQVKQFGFDRSVAYIALMAEEGVVSKHLRRLRIKGAQVLEQASGLSLTRRLTLPFRPHITLGEMSLKPVRANTQLFSEWKIPGEIEVRVLVDRVALFRRPFGQPRRKYTIVQQAQLRTEVYRAP